MLQSTSTITPFRDPVKPKNGRKTNWGGLIGEYGKHTTCVCDPYHDEWFILFGVCISHLDLLPCAMEATD